MQRQGQKVLGNGEVPKDLLAAIEDVAVFLNYLQKCYRDLNQGATAQLLVMCNRTAVHNQLLQHGFQAAWFRGLRIATTSSAAPATARIAVVVQTGCGFLSGGRRGASMEDREDCFGRATVALTRAIKHTYIVSLIDMAGMIGMAQTLAVYHYRYYTLKNRCAQYHEPKRVPSDAEAVLEWGLNTPFKLQNKPPLAIAMVVTVWGTLPEKISIGSRAEVEVAPHAGGHSSIGLTGGTIVSRRVASSRVLLIVSTCMAMQGMDTDLLYGFVLLTMALHRLRGSKIHFHQATKDRRILLIPGVHCFDAPPATTALAGSCLTRSVASKPSDRT